MEGVCVWDRSRALHAQMHLSHPGSSLFPSFSLLCGCGPAPLNLVGYLVRRALVNLIVQETPPHTMAASVPSFPESPPSQFWAANTVLS